MRAGHHRGQVPEGDARDEDLLGLHQLAVFVIERGEDKSYVHAELLGSGSGRALRRPSRHGGQWIHGGQGIRLGAHVNAEAAGAAGLFECAELPQPNQLKLERLSGASQKGSTGARFGISLRP